MTPLKKFNDLLQHTTNGESKKVLANKNDFLCGNSTSSWHVFTHHRVQQGRQCAGHLTKPRQATYLEYAQKIVLQHQGNTNPTAISLRGHRREVSPAE
ncbi:hypothetical protein TNCV_5021371 [Trichonephila clavipes]|nr:hypothetical protein TNCV_5021371 [Trichonephila clavipes]